ncbi:large subunit ribosomal protein L4 [Thermonema lapsum]|uniref:Large ribosomal subunit protein uL4 n=1 Tax=Thermonema lapsum TaxID=28195 RepID=A0A846MSY1_9BACT|nr:50S ribosomal protein L4 [Thermonema lapsum]NIK74565.1 large subunit ribosomal protein L4 [Thermonema lapsum]
MELAVYNINGEDTGRKVTLSDEVFGITPNDHLIYLDVKRYLANQRQGTHKTKERSEISGSTRKLRRQKGTGFARIGDIKSPLLRGGGRIFGPKPRDYSFKLNKKETRLARKSALAYKAKENNILVLENFSFEQPKTKQFLAILQKLGLDSTKTLFVLPGLDKIVYLSARNLPKAQVLPAEQINTYAILNAEKLVICEGAIEKIENTLNA